MSHPPPARYNFRLRILPGHCSRILPAVTSHELVAAVPDARPAGCAGRRFDDLQLAVGLSGLWASIGCSLAIGGSLAWIGRKARDAPMLRKEALAIVGLGWVLAGSLGALPFLLSGTETTTDGPGGKPIVIRVGVADAVFESISGFTTTGASVLTHVEADSDPTTPNVPRCILFWRSFTHWLGGMGIVVLFVAILRRLGAGGKALLRGEVPGPMSETVRPRVQQAAMVMLSLIHI